MFIEPGRQFYQAPEERHLEDVAPPELGELLQNAFYKHSAPLALGTQRVSQQHQNEAQPKTGVYFMEAGDVRKAREHIEDFAGFCRIHGIMNISSRIRP